LKTVAAILVEQRKPLEIDELDVPALGYGQVLVELKVSRICGSQIGEIDGVKGPDKYLPHLVGHEGGGIVREVGPEVAHVKPGDHVVLHWRPGAGIQARAVKYSRRSETINAGNITTFQQFTVVSENRVTRIPVDVDFEIAALLADTLTTGFGAVNRNAQIEIGEAVVVIGVGGIGLGTVLGAHLAGAHPVIAVDVHDHKLAKAREFGATHTINSKQEHLPDAVQRILGGPADAVFDGTGNPAVIEQAWKITSPRGRLILVGVMPHDRQFCFNTLSLHYGKVLTGSEGGMSRPQVDIPRILRLIDGGRIDPRGLVTHRCKLAEVNAAITAMRAGESVHTMIHFGAGK
jgi:S-(hydroxymethyl)glutathione dehydrogenase/alcohol dehydrogenase